MEPQWKKLKRGSYAKLTIAVNEDEIETDNVVATKTKSRVCENQVSYQLVNQGESVPLPHSAGQYGAVIVGSRAPFTINQTLIQYGPLAGRLAFVVDPIPDPEDIFPLMRLPVELRYMIFRHLLKSPFVINLIGWLSGQRGFLLASGANTIDSSILSVSKQIYKEGVSILYSMNTFVFEDNRSIVRFLEHIGTLSTTFLRKIAVGKWYIKHGKPLLSALAKLPALQQFILWHPHPSELKNIAKACKGWFDHHSTTEREVDRLIALIRIGRCGYCLGSRYNEEKLHVKCHNKQEGHVEVKEELAGLIDDVIL
ncbi:D-arabinose 1-dehydrogenase [Sphaceloma murrayae]|uniref:D-arabinose 1-dehydrogenase n=1 Tax=Sphaceloma murrayae TaxID=2082308 RepID=A0A2K1QR49_9PEZI|nr:D-arabinose 1-dehydrogenase [Sphaceloma murrayae]